MISLMKFVAWQLFSGVVPMWSGFGSSPALKTFQGVEGADTSIAGDAGANAGVEGNAARNAYGMDMRATHSLTPEQQNQMLTAATAGAGGAFGGAEGQINANAARTGNATSVTKSLDEMARDRAKVGAGAAEGIAAQDAAGTNALHQTGAAGMQGLYGLDTSRQLAAMKGVDEAAQGAMAAQPGVLSQVEGILNTASNVGSAAAGLKAA